MVDRVRGFGMQVLAFDPFVTEAPPGVELAGFRIVQEALTNVLKHAGAAASATVTLGYETDDVVIDISDNGRGAASGLSNSGGGNGLVGMRERVEIYGGSLSAGPLTGGGYRVRAVLPTGEPVSRFPATSSRRDLSVQPSVMSAASPTPEEVA